MDISARIVDNIPSFTGGLEKKLSAAVRKAAFDVEAKAKEAAPVDIGFLQASIFTVTSEASGAGAAQAAATKRLTKGWAARDFRQKVPIVRNPLVAYVIVGAAYGPYVERDSPFLLPARDAVEPELRRAIASILRQG